MKNKYITPETLVLEVNCESVLLEGSKFDDGSDGTQLVKEDYNVTLPSHSVWDDDWSE